MTNAEKFKEVFGIEPDMEVCPVECAQGYVGPWCPFYEELDNGCHGERWWKKEYAYKDVWLFQSYDQERNTPVFQLYDDMHSAEWAKLENATDGLINELYSVLDLMEYLDENKLNLVGTFMN